MEEIVKRINKCRRCPLHKWRTNIVIGEGGKRTEIIFIGEAPGLHEDKMGRPFVGRAGKILDELIESIELKREDVYITNVVKCRPPNNRDPSEDEINSCIGYLFEQIRMIKPKIIVALGRIASSALLGKPVSLWKEHGSLVDYPRAKCKLFITYHPAAAIYSGEVRSKLQDDFKKLKNIRESMG
ncbi:MAG: uracil-DNA glycosylase family protein [Candidatus Hydrothermarchaeota archaeon]